MRYFHRYKTVHFSGKSQKAYFHRPVELDFILYTIGMESANKKNFNASQTLCLPW